MLLAEQQQLLNKILDKSVQGGIEMETTPGKGAATIAKNYSKGFKMVHNLN